MRFHTRDTTLNLRPSNATGAPGGGLARMALSLHWEVRVQTDSWYDPAVEVEGGSLSCAAKIAATQRCCHPFPGLA